MIDKVHLVPAEEMTVVFPDLRAGAMWRRRVRHAIRSARVLGAEVHATEHWRLLDSRFTIRAVGTEEAVAPVMALLLLAQEHKTTERN